MDCYQYGNIRMFHGDCMEFMRSVPELSYDLAIIDPPYGIGEDGGKNRGCSVKQKNGTTLKIKHVGYEKRGWDTEPPSFDYFDELLRVSKNQILWGANHYSDRLPFPSPAWVVWDKVNGDSDFADCEMAWTSFPSAARLFAFMWNGMMQGCPEDGRKMQGNKKLNEERIHPTQKPIPLYSWLLENYAKPGDKILDTHGGSGSIVIACHALGFPIDWIELDRDYYARAVRRFKRYIGNPEEMHGVDWGVPPQLKMF